MEKNYIWVISNNDGRFIKACATRETAKMEMEEWRKNFIKAEIFLNVSELDAVYYDRITFKVTGRDGKVETMSARQTILY